MKLKKWLPEYKKITYAEYKALPDYDRWEIEEEFRGFNRREQIHASQGWRLVTEEEKKRLGIVHEKEKNRYETSLKIGGIDERGNYTALSHRWENGCIGKEKVWDRNRRI